MATKTEPKKNITLTLRPRIRAMGQQLAESDKRYLSDEVEWLIEKEALARGMNGSSFLPGSNARSKRAGKRNGKQNGG